MHVIESHSFKHARYVITGLVFQEQLSPETCLRVFFRALKNTVDDFNSQLGNRQPLVTVGAGTKQMGLEQLADLSDLPPIVQEEWLR